MLDTPAAQVHARITQALALLDKTRVLMVEALAMVPDEIGPADTYPAVATGEGPDALVLHVVQDAWKGDAQFTVSVDGRQLGGTFTAKASRAAKETHRFRFLGSWAAGPH